MQLRRANLIVQTEPLPEDSELWDLDNVLMTPHRGGVPHNFWEISMELFVQQAQRLAAGQQLLNVVDKQRSSQSAAEATS